MHRAILFFLFVFLVSIRVASSANAQSTRGGRSSEQGPNKDAFYKLGPDSMPIEGIPKGKWAGPTIIPSDVFPGYQHTYNVVVPAQYDPAIPVAVMVFNDSRIIRHLAGWQAN